MGNKRFKYKPWSSSSQKAGIVGNITSIGNFRINYYETDYDIGFKGKLKSIGLAKFIYYRDISENRKSGIVGKFKKQTGNDSNIIIR